MGVCLWREVWTEGVCMDRVCMEGVCMEGGRHEGESAWRGVWNAYLCYCISMSPFTMFQFF